MWLVVVVVSRDPVMLLSLKLFVVWVSMFVLLVCTVSICLFVFVLVGVVFEVAWLILGRCLGLLPFQM